MVLQPLEFSECLEDSPQFRDKLYMHEKELERTSKSIKNLVKECSELLNAETQLHKAQCSFSKLLNEFEFECIGAEKTDDEALIEQSFKEFSKIISATEDSRNNMLRRIQDAVITPISNFRKQQIGEAKKGRQTYEKQTSRYYQLTDKYLSIKPTKTTEAQMAETDKQWQGERYSFYRDSMSYVLKLQEVQERKKFEFVEMVLQLMFSWKTFYHESYDSYNDEQIYMQDLNSRLQKCRANFVTTRDEALNLMEKMLSAQIDNKQSEHSKQSATREGYLFMLEKKALTNTWTKYYCQYSKEQKLLSLLPFNQLNNNKTTNPSSRESYTLTSCVRRAGESIDKRFCFDVTLHEKQGAVTLQAMSEEDRKLWMEAMDGREPIYDEPPGVAQLSKSLLDDIGFNFIKKCIQAVEAKGLEDEGLYRVVGVNSKVTKLTSMLLDRKKADKVDLLTDQEVELKTITSALKNYFRGLPEPLMTFKLHEAFIRAAKQESKTLRINDIHELVHQLPESNFEMMEHLVAHLKKVSEYSAKNLMTVSNIGVCFGPTLMRPREESMAAIIDIKFCNLVVEILIDNYQKIFKSRPEFADLSNSRVLDSKPATTSTTLSSHTASYTTSSFNKPSPAKPVVMRTKAPNPPYNYASTYSTPYSHSTHNSASSNDATNSASLYSTPHHSSHHNTASTHTALTTSLTSSMTSSTSSAINLQNRNYAASMLYQNNLNIKNDESTTAGSGGHYYTTPTPQYTQYSRIITNNFNVKPTTYNNNAHNNNNSNTSAKTTTNNARNMSPYTSRSATKPLFSSPRTTSYQPTDLGPDAHSSASSSTESLNLRSSNSSSQSNFNHANKYNASRNSFSNNINNKNIFNNNNNSNNNNNNVMMMSDSGSYKNQNYSPMSSSTRSIHSASRTVRTLYSCTAENDSELSFEPNQLIENVRQSNEPGWLEGTLNGQKGLIPANYVEYIN